MLGKLEDKIFVESSERDEFTTYFDNVRLIYKDNEEVNL